MPARAKPCVLAEREFLQLQQLLRNASGIVLAAERRALVAGRLTPRLRRFQLDTFSDYLALLALPTSAAERAVAVDLLLCQETYFFREHRHFEFLAQWLALNPHARHFWSAACASGEEAYSLAMVATEHAHNHDWSVFASDLSHAALRRLEKGVYDLAQARYFPDGWLQRHCLCGSGEMAGRMRVQPSLRARIQAQPINLARSLPVELGSFDVVFLRNLLMYFCPQERQQMLQRLLLHLRPGGLLVIGHSETIDAASLALRPVLPSVFERL